MIITTLFAYLVVRRQWGWRRGLAMPVFGALLLLDLAFFAANATKIVDGGWFPLVFGGVVFLLLTHLEGAGASCCMKRLDTAGAAARRISSPASKRRTSSRVPGTAVFLTPYPEQCRTRCCTTSSTTRCCTSASC